MVKKVLVIGDSCSDIFRYGICERINPEAPVPILKPTKTVVNEGMASNVFLNLKALGSNCDIVTNSARPIKTRFVEENSNQMVLRTDENDAVVPIKKDSLESINFSTYDAVVVVDYNKGFLSEKDIEYIVDSHGVVFVDSKKEFDKWCDGAFCIKINEKEYVENSKFLSESLSTYLVVTLGGSGARLEPEMKIFGVKNDHPVRDLSGAGDTFLAALVFKYLEKEDIYEAIEFANKCASWVVTQKGVVPVDVKKI